MVFSYENVIIPDDRPVIIVHRGWQVSSKSSGAKGMVLNKNGGITQTENWRINATPASRAKSQNSTFEAKAWVPSDQQSTGDESEALPSTRRSKKREKSSKFVHHNKRGGTVISFEKNFQKRSPEQKQQKQISIDRQFSHLPASFQGPLATDAYLNYCKPRSDSYSYASKLNTWVG